jgi:hypothetical protein
METAIRDAAICHAPTVLHGSVHDGNAIDLGRSVA